MITAIEAQAAKLKRLYREHCAAIVDDGAPPFPAAVHAQNRAVLKAIDDLAALAHQSPPTGVSGSQAKSEAVAVAKIVNGNLAWNLANPTDAVPVDLLRGEHPLYAAPQEAVERQPLTPEQARNVWRRWTAEGHAQCDWLSLLRLTERAHGIGPATQEMQR